VVDPATLSAPGFPRIADYAVLSDCHTSALVGDADGGAICVRRSDVDCSAAA
jgi:hypothetical protein